MNLHFPEKVDDVVEVATVEEKIVLIGSWGGSESIFTLEKDENKSSKLKIDRVEDLNLMQGGRLLTCKVHI